MTHDNCGYLVFRIALEVILWLLFKTKTWFGCNVFDKKTPPRSKAKISLQNLRSPQNPMFNIACYQRLYHSLKRRKYLVSFCPMSENDAGREIMLLIFWLPLRTNEIFSNDGTGRSFFHYNIFNIWAYGEIFTKCCHQILPANGCLFCVKINKL